MRPGQGRWAMTRTRGVARGGCPRPAPQMIIRPHARFSKCLSPNPGYFSRRNRRNFKLTSWQLRTRNFCTQVIERAAPVRYFRGALPQETTACDSRIAAIGLPPFRWPFGWQRG